MTKTQKLEATKKFFRSTSEFDKKKKLLQSKLSPSVLFGIFNLLSMSKKILENV